MTHPLTRLHLPGHQTEAQPKPHTHTHNTHGTQTYSGGLDKRILSSRSRFDQILQIFFSVCFASDEPSPTTFIKPIVVAFPCQLFHIEYSLTLPKPFVFAENILEFLCLTLLLLLSKLGSDLWVRVLLPEDLGWSIVWGTIIPPRHFFG